MAGLGQDIKVYDENYSVEAGLTVPKDDTANTRSLELGKGAQNASINVKGVVKEEMNLEGTKKLTIKLQDSADDSSFADKAVLAEITATGSLGYDQVFPAGTVLFEHVLAPDTRKYTRISVTTDDSAVEGKLELYPQIVPR